MPADPFPDCLCTADAIVHIGWMFATIGIVLLFIVIMLFLYLKTNEFLPILFVYCFSLLIGIVSFSVSRMPFTPYLQIFFVLFQTIIFYLVCTKTNFTEVLKKREKS